MSTWSCKTVMVCRITACANSCIPEFLDACGWMLLIDLSLKSCHLHVCTLTHRYQLDHAWYNIQNLSLVHACDWNPVTGSLYSAKHNENFHFNCFPFTHCHQPPHTNWSTVRLLVLGSLPITDKRPTMYAW